MNKPVPKLGHPQKKNWNFSLEMAIFVNSERYFILFFYGNWPIGDHQENVCENVR